VYCGGSGAFFLAAESSVIPVGKNGAVAFDLLYKLHYVTNASYATTLKYFYHFMDFFVYKLSSRNLPSVTNLHTQLKNVVIGSIRGDDDGSNEDVVGEEDEEK